MNIIIFGAAGGIGKHAVKYALAKGYQVTAYLRDKNKLNIWDKNLRIVEGGNFRLCFRVKSTGRPGCCHLVRWNPTQEKV